METFPHKIQRIHNLYILSRIRAGVNFSDIITLSQIFEAIIQGVLVKKSLKKFRLRRTLQELEKF